MVYIMLLCGMWLMNSAILSMEQILFEPTKETPDLYNYGEYIIDDVTKYEEKCDPINKFLDFLDNNSNVCSKIHDFIRLYELGSIDNFTPAEIIRWLKKPDLVTFIENVALATQKKIKEYKESYKIKKMLAQQGYYEKIAYVIDNTPILIEELQYCHVLPLDSYYEQSSDEQSSDKKSPPSVLRLQSIWYMYCLHLIPNMKIYEKNEIYMICTYKPMNKYPLPFMIDTLKERRKRFNRLFLHLHYLNKIEDFIIPNLEIFIEHHEKNSQPVPHFLSILMALKRLLALKKPSKITYMDTRDQKELNVSWQKFWTEIYNQAIKPELLSASQYAPLINANPFIAAVDNRLINNQNPINSQDRSNDDNSSTSTEEEIFNPETQEKCDPTEKSCFYSWFFAANLGGVADKQKKE